MVLLRYCNCEVKLLKLKANYNHYHVLFWFKENCNCEVKLLKLKANYNIVIAITL